MIIEDVAFIKKKECYAKGMIIPKNMKNIIQPSRRENEDYEPTKKEKRKYKWLSWLVMKKMRIKTCTSWTLYNFTIIKLEKIQKSDNIKCWQGHGMTKYGSQKVNL